MAKSKTTSVSSNNTKKTVKTKKRVPNKVKEAIENTTRIRIDKDRLNDTASLDTSFLEGRVDAQSRKRVLNSKPKNKKAIDLTILRNVILMVILLTLLILTVLALMNHSTSKTKEPKVKKVKEEKIVKIVDDNYLFVGDSYISNLNFDELDYHYNKLSDDNYTTEDVLNNINDIYRYNPSVVIIEVGRNDLEKGTEEVDIVTNMSEIIDGIKKNRLYAKIYVESLYPINTEVEGFDSENYNESINNERITGLNDMLKELAKDKKIEYIDAYKKMIVEDKLNSEYTDDGLSLNENGYVESWNLIRKVVDQNGGTEN